MLMTDMVFVRVSCSLVVSTETNFRVRLHVINYEKGVNTWLSLRRYQTLHSSDVTCSGGKLNGSVWIHQRERVSERVDGNSVV